MKTLLIVGGAVVAGTATYWFGRGRRGRKSDVSRVKKFFSCVKDWGANLLTPPTQGHPKELAS